MKKILFSFVLVVSVCINAVYAVNNVNYIETQQGLVYGKSIEKSWFSFKVIDENNVVHKYCIKDVVAYCKNGVRYDLLPVYKNGEKTNNKDYFELIRYKSGFKLYKYSFCDPLADTDKQIDAYYVFKDGAYIDSLTEMNRNSFIAYFSHKQDAKLEACNK